MLNDLQHLTESLSSYQKNLVDILIAGKSINPFRKYAPRGASIQAIFNIDSEVVISGAAGTGKSRACLEKLNYCALQYDNCRILIVRKTRSSLSDTGMVTFERDVLGIDHPMIINGAQRYFRRNYKYDNGSEIVLGGMDKPGRVLSGEYDLIYVQQAEEMQENDWETLTTRLRSGIMPFQQIIGCCNPDRPTHWLKQRCDAKKTILYNGQFEDNPLLWDNEKKDWTKFGKEYVAKLDALTGARKQRLRYGKWVQSEGLIYQEWNAAIHIIDRFDIPDNWRRIRVVDFGYTNPFVCFDMNTEVLTNTGWKFFSDLNSSELVASVDMKTRQVEYQKPTSYIEQHYDGPMITCEPKRIGANFSVTPNHRMVLENRKNDKGWQFYNAGEMPTGNYSIPVGWNEIKSGTDKESIAFARFLGIWLADGCLSRGGHNNKQKRVRIAQKHYPDEIRNIISDLGYKWSEYVNKKNGVIDFTVSGNELYDKLYNLCGKVKAKDKKIPQDCFLWDKERLEALLDGLFLGDGTPQIKNKDGIVIASKKYSTISMCLANDVQAIGSLLGYPTKLNSYIAKKSKFRKYKVRVFNVLFTVHKRAALSRVPIKNENYSGMIYCVTVPNGAMIVRRGGRPMVCGNCQWWCIDSDDRMYLYREIYHTGRTVKVHSEKINELSEGEYIEQTICDHDAEDRATLEENNIFTISADKRVQYGFEKVKERLKIAGDGRSRLFIMCDSIVEIDQSLVDAKKPTCTAQEFDGYVWSNSKTKEEPKKQDDHGMDAVRYGVMGIEIQGIFFG